MIKEIIFSVRKTVNLDFVMDKFDDIYSCLALMEPIYFDCQ